MTALVNLPGREALSFHNLIRKDRDVSDNGPKDRAETRLTARKGRSPATQRRSPGRLRDRSQHSRVRPALQVIGHPRLSLQGDRCLPEATDAKSATIRRMGLETWAGGRGGSSGRGPERDRLMEAARRREIDIISVWWLDRWGRWLAFHRSSTVALSRAEPTDFETSVGP